MSSPQLVGPTRFQAGQQNLQVLQQGLQSIQQLGTFIESQREFNEQEKRLNRQTNLQYASGLMNALAEVLPGGYKELATTDAGKEVMGYTFALMGIPKTATGSLADRISELDVSSEEMAKILQRIYAKAGAQSGDDPAKLGNDVLKELDDWEKLLGAEPAKYLGTEATPEAEAAAEKKLLSTRPQVMQSPETPGGRSLESVTTWQSRNRPGDAFTKMKVDIFREAQKGPGKVSADKIVKQYRDEAVRNRDADTVAAIDGWFTGLGEAGPWMTFVQEATQGKTSDPDVEAAIKAERTAGTAKFASEAEVTPGGASAGSAILKETPAEREAAKAAQKNVAAQTVNPEWEKWNASIEELKNKITSGTVTVADQAKIARIASPFEDAKSMKEILRIERTMTPEVKKFAQQQLNDPTFLISLDPAVAAAVAASRVTDPNAALKQQTEEAELLVRLAKAQGLEPALMELQLEKAGYDTASAKLKLLELSSTLKLMSVDPKMAAWVNSYTTLAGQLQESQAGYRDLANKKGVTQDELARAQRAIVQLENKVNSVKSILEKVLSAGLGTDVTGELDAIMEGVKKYKSEERGKGFFIFPGARKEVSVPGTTAQPAGAAAAPTAEAPSADYQSLQRDVLR